MVLVTLADKLAAVGPEPEFKDYAARQFHVIAAAEYARDKIARRERMIAVLAEALGQAQEYIAGDGGLELFNDIDAILDAAEEFK